MTEKEAIKWLGVIKQVYSGYPGEAACNIAIKALEEIQQYRAIGTAEECREAVEKQKPKRRELINSGISVCPECGAKVKRCYDFCKDCGQAIDWSEEK